MNAEQHNSPIGSGLADFLREEGIYEACYNEAIKEVLAWQVMAFMKEHRLTKTVMAERMNTSRAALNRLLDEKNTSVTLHTLIRAAETIGKKLRLEII
jgi:antitoxin HicB